MQMRPAIWAPNSANSPLQPSPTAHGPTTAGSGADNRLCERATVGSWRTKRVRTSHIPAALRTRVATQWPLRMGVRASFACAAVLRLLRVRAREQ